MFSKFTSALVFACILPLSATFASDHIDGPVTTKHRIADLSDLYSFPTPSKPGWVTIILNAYPIVPSGGHFSDKVSHNIYVRKAAINASAAPKKFDTTDEVVFLCTFATPHDTVNHSVTCKASNGLTATNKYGSTANPATNAFNLYAGMRLDPFFFNFAWANSASSDGVLKAPKNDNVMERMNILTIVLEIDTAKLFSAPSAMLALAAETTTQDSPTAALRRLDRLGRPEITNVSLVAHKGDPDLRDQYNLDRPFQVSDARRDQYKTQLSKNIAFYDAIDKKSDWTAEARAHLTSLFMEDYLIVDISKPCTGSTYLEIEKALLAGRAHTTCGGRQLTDDIMDTMFTLYIAGPAGARIRDGVDQPSIAPSKAFPYLIAPDLSALSKTKAFFAKQLLRITN